MLITVMFWEILDVGRIEKGVVWACGEEVWDNLNRVAKNTMSSDQDRPLIHKPLR